MDTNATNPIIPNALTMTPIAGKTTEIPNSGGKTFKQFGEPTAGSGCMAFFGGNEDVHGIYLQAFLNTTEVQGESLQIVCDSNSDLPTIGTPTIIGNAPCIAHGSVYFYASNGITQGIYQYNMSNAEIGEIYVCPCTDSMSKFTASKGRVSFEISGDSDPSQNGIWLIEEDNLAKRVVETNTPVQILHYPMNQNYQLSATGTPHLEGDKLYFVGEMINNADGKTEQALILYRVVGGGLLSILKDGDELPNGNQLVGHKPFKSPIACHGDLITCKVEYNHSDQSSTYHMVIAIDSQFNIAHVASNDATLPNGDIFTNDFAFHPMASGGKVVFVSDVEMPSSTPSINMFSWSHVAGLETALIGAEFPYQGKQYLQAISHSSEGFYQNMVVARCFWNDGQSNNEDWLGIYAFFL